jgi:hypothetical protein
VSHKTSHGLQHVVLRLPGGERYGLELGAEELAEWLAPDRRASHEAGGLPVQVEVSHAGNRVVVAVAPKELTRWLSRARLEVEAGKPIGPEPVHDPSRGRGTHDPAEHRLGPNADRPPDPTHHGPRRHRRLP